jgi:flagellin-like hook-associated protein FlgL
MLPSLSAATNQFLNDLSRVQSVITTTTAQLTSGYRINQPSDAPDQISPLLQLMANTSSNQTVLENLTNVQATVSGADQAVSSANLLLQQATSLGAQGASSTTSATTRAQLAQQVASIQEQMVALAGTQVAGRYIFSGDQAGSQPYALNLNAPPVQIGSAPATLIKPGDTASFTIQTATGKNSFTLTGQNGDTLQSQLGELNAQMQADGYDITASLDLSGTLQFRSNSGFSVSASAGNTANLVDTALQVSDNTGLNTYQFTGQTPAAAGGSDIGITVGGTTATATLADPTAPTQGDVDAINAALRTQGITSVSALLDLSGAGNTISFQGTAEFSISDDHLVSGTYAANGNSFAGVQNGVDRLVAQQATRQIDVGNHTSIAVDQTAQDLFDHRNADDSPAPDNVFATLNSLRLALINNNTDEISAAQTSLDTASQYLNSRDVFYGSVTNRISAAVTQLNTQNVSLQQQISSIRDTDVVAAAVTLTSAETQNQAALDAEAKLPRTTLFDYLG